MEKNKISADVAEVLTAAVVAAISTGVLLLAVSLFVSGK
jgi:hypothetical protein